MRNGGARAYGLVQRDVTVETRGETACAADQQIVADNAETLDAVMQPIETRPFKLTEPVGNDTAPSVEPMVESRTQMHVEAVGQEVAAAKRFSVADQLVEVEPHGRIVGAHDRSRADADDRINANIVSNELAKHPDVGGATQAAPGQYHGDVNSLRSVRHSFPGLIAQSR